MTVMLKRLDRSSTRGCSVRLAARHVYSPTVSSDGLVDGLMPKDPPMTQAFSISAESIATESKRVSALLANDPSALP